MSFASPFFCPAQDPDVSIFPLSHVLWNMSAGEAVFSGWMEIADKTVRDEARQHAEEDALVFRRLPGKENWLAVLKACPVSPDDVPRRRRAPAGRRKL